MFSIVDNKESSTSIPIFNIQMSTSDYNIYDYLDSPTLVDGYTSDIDDFISSYGYRYNPLGTGTSQVDLRYYRLTYKSIKISNDESAYLETVYGQIVQPHLYSIVIDSNHIRVYAHESILLLGPIILKYDSNDLSGFINNDYELINLDILRATDSDVTEIEPKILLNYKPRLLQIGNINTNIYEHTFCYTRGAFSDGVKQYKLNVTADKQLVNVPVRIYKNFVYLPTPYSTGDVKLIITDKNYNTTELSITPDSYDNYNNVIMIKGTINQTHIDYYRHRIKTTASYRSKINMIDNLQLNPLYTNGMVDNSTAIRSKPVKIYLSGNPSSIMVGVGIHNEDVYESITEHMLHAFTIVYGEEDKDSVLISKVNREANINSDQKESLHYAGNTSIDGIYRDMSSVLLLQCDISVYDEIVKNYIDYDYKSPDILATNKIREIMYQYTPLGRHVVIEFLDSVDGVVKVVKRIL